MSKDCSAKISKQQKLLLKVLNCLWVQYVSQRTGATKAFFKSPSQEGYDAMAEELGHISGLLNSNDAVKKLDTNDVKASAEVISFYATGQCAYDSSELDVFNNYEASLNRVRINGGVQKPLQNLNTNECIEQSYQIRPYYVSNNSNWVTQAIVVERTGCSGVSNTGFVGLALDVDINYYPFNVCDEKSLSCYPKCNKKNKH